MSIEELLDLAGYSYDIDEDGDYTITIEYTDLIRSQKVFVSGECRQLEGAEIVEIWSIANPDVKKLPPQASLRDLLNFDPKRLIGAWRINDSDALVYSIKVPLEGLTPEFLSVFIKYVSRNADDFEEVHSLDDDL